MVGEDVPVLNRRALGGRILGGNKQVCGKTYGRRLGGSKGASCKNTGYHGRRLSFLEDGHGRSLGGSRGSVCCCQNGVCDVGSTCGCGLHGSSKSPICYVRDPENCPWATDSSVYNGARWRPCDMNAPPAPPRPPYMIPPPPPYPPCPPPGGVGGVVYGTCELPRNTLQYSVITSGDATLCAHSMYRAVAIGGTLYDGTSQETGTIEGTYPSSIRAMAFNSNFNFKAPPNYQDPIPFQWTDYEWLALNAVDVNRNGYRVKVVDQGDYPFSYDGAFFGATQSEDNGRTLAVFTGRGQVRLVASQNGRQFGPSVLAPSPRSSSMATRGTSTAR